MTQEQPEDPWLCHRPGRDFVTSFRLPVSPLPGESLLSLVGRAAQANAHRELMPVLSHVGASASLASLAEHRDAILPSLAILLKLPAEAVAARYHAPPDNHLSARTAEASFFGTPVPRRWLRWEKRIAPNTMEHRGYHSALWELQIFEVCPDSGEPLRSTCPSCNQVLRWRLTDLHRCDHCNARLISKADTTWAAAGRDLSGVRFIADVLAPWRGARDQAIASLPQDLQEVPPAELVRLMVTIPRLLPGAPVPELQRVPRAGGFHTEYLRWPCQTLAYSLKMLRSWPESVRDAMARLVLSPNVGRRDSISLFLPASFTKHLMMIQRDSNLRHRLGDLGAEYLLLREFGRVANAKRIPIDGRSALYPYVNGADLEYASFLQLQSVNRISAAVGWSANRIRHLLALMPELRTTATGKSPGAPILLDATHTKDIIRSIDAASTVTEAAKKLGVSAAICRDVLRRGLLEQFDPALARLRVQQGDFLVSATALHEFEMRLARWQEPGAARDPVGLRAAVSLLLRGFFDSTDIIALMLDGRLPYFATHLLKGQAQCFGYVFERADILRLAQTTLCNAPLTLNDAAIDLGWSRRTLSALLDAGLVATSAGDGGEGVSIQRAEIERLKLSYRSMTDIVLGLLDEEGPIARRLVEEKLWSSGVRPLTATCGEHPNLQPLWETVDFTPALLAHLVDWFRVNGRWLRDA